MNNNNHFPSLKAFHHNIFMNPYLLMARSNPYKSHNWNNKYSIIIFLLSFFLTMLIYVLFVVYLKIIIIIFFQVHRRNQTMNIFLRLSAKLNPFITVNTFCIASGIISGFFGIIEVSC